jgi:transcriptional regulator with XRE-family HTH domain
MTAHQEKLLSVRAHLAQNVRFYRTNLGLSQEQLGNECGFHRTFVSQIERCVNGATVDTVERLAVRLGVEPFELLKPRASTDK